MKSLQDFNFRFLTEKEHNKYGRSYATHCCCFTTIIGKSRVFVYDYTGAHYDYYNDRISEVNINFSNYLCLVLNLPKESYLKLFGPKFCKKELVITNINLMGLATNVDRNKLIYALNKLDYLESKINAQG